MGMTAAELEKEAPHIRDFCRRLVATESGLFTDPGSEAEDLAGEVLAIATIHKDSFQRKSAVRTWLISICIRQFCNLLRKTRSRGEKAPTESLDAGPAEFRNLSFKDLVVMPDGDPCLQLLQEEIVGRVRSALLLVKPEYRFVIVLRDYLDLTYHEMTEYLAIPEGTVKSRLFRARKQLRQLLEEYVLGDK